MARHQGWVERPQRKDDKKPRGRCFDCDWQGPERDTTAEAREDVRAHRADWGEEAEHAGA